MDDALLTCPRCTSPLGDGACARCGLAYPEHDGVRCLLHDADQACGRFAARFDEVARESAAQLAAITDELARDAIARARLQAFAAGVRTSAATIAALAPQARAARDEAVPSVAGHASLFDHYEYVFRDWAWDDAENELACNRVIEAAGDPTRPRVLVLGAGACRLAYDLHHRLDARATVALDIQPLLLAIASRMFAGDTLALAEFTANHLATPHAVALRSLRAPAPARPGLTLVCADATRPPVRNASFDLVVAPWFLDQLHCDVRDVLPAIHGALADGGRFVFHGPLLHPRGKPLARCFTEAELLARLPTAGFEPCARRCEALPYLRAPEGSARTEPVLTIAAKKIAGADLPPWLQGIALPIPRTAKRPSSDPLAAAIAALIDGERSALAIATLLSRRGGLAPHLALDATLAGLHTLVRQ
ncbi:MAG TPA: class I SAM-dependent methyltransferase [Nannocystaceae bacterium]|nr:class I SAM-dependent methyltransferase [Nannocystaceae bacterium]